MPKGKVVFVKCTFSRGGFPSERVFRVDAPNGGVYAGTAPVGYCYSLTKELLKDEIPSGQRVPGLVVGLTVDAKDLNGLVRVYLPDNELYDLNPNLLEPEVLSRVPIQS